MDHFDVRIESANYLGLRSSYPNSMVVNTVNIGQELYGSSGAIASYANFQYNQYVAASDNISYYFTNNGWGIGPNNPPFDTWLPAPSLGGTGGVWWTCTSC